MSQYSSCSPDLLSSINSSFLLCNQPIRRYNPRRWSTFGTAHSQGETLFSKTPQHLKHVCYALFIAADILHSSVCNVLPSLYYLLWRVRLEETNSKHWHLSKEVLILSPPLKLGEVNILIQPFQYFFLQNVASGTPAQLKEVWHQIWQKAWNKLH